MTIQTAITGAHATAAESKPDSLFEMASDLETEIGKLDALAHLIGRLTDDTDLVLFSLMYSVQAIRNETRAVCDRLYAASSAARPEEVRP